MSCLQRKLKKVWFVFPDIRIDTNDDILTHHLLVFEVDLHATAEGFKFTGYGHVGNSLEKQENKHKL